MNQIIFIYSVDMDAHMFCKLGNRFTKSKMSTEKIALRRFKSFFGVTPNVCSIAWNEIKNQAPPAAQPKHLLWCLWFLKEYSTEHHRRSLFKADEKTIRYWTWTFVKLLANLNVVSSTKFFFTFTLHELPCLNIFTDSLGKSIRRSSWQSCFCSLDGLDLPILEPTPFSPKWFSHKFRGAGVRYEIALNIRTEDIVWTNGGYPCGEFPDLKVAREAYVLSVNPGELTVADRGYNDALFFIQKTARNYEDHGIIMARHETVNKRVKQFKILKYTYRHSLEKHPLVFSAVVNVTQLMLKNGFPLFKALN